MLRLICFLTFIVRGWSLTTTGAVTRAAAAAAETATFGQDSGLQTGSGRGGLDPASVWLIYSKMNLNAFDVPPRSTSRQESFVVSRRPGRRTTTSATTTKLLRFFDDAPTSPMPLLIEHAANRTACRVEQDGADGGRGIVDDVTLRTDDVVNADESTGVFQSVVRPDIFPTKYERNKTNGEPSESSPATESSAKASIVIGGTERPITSSITTSVTAATTAAAAAASANESDTAADNDVDDDDELDDDAPTEQKLMYRLLEHYEKSVRPVRNASETVLVKMGLTLTQIFNMDEKNQVLVTNAWLDQEWEDVFLQWDPAEYGGLEVLRLPCHKLWLPDIVLYNNAAEYTDGLMPANAMITSAGNVFWPIPAKLLSTCKVDVTYFPFDEQFCHLKFGSWTYDGFQVDMTNRTTSVDIDLSNYVENGEWELLNITIQRNVVYYACCKEPFPDVTFTVHIRRRTLYYLYNVIFPCVMMSALTLLVFCLPPDSGEKVTMGITVLLSFSVFLLRMGEDLPETSEFIPLLSVYLTIVMAMTSVSVIMTVFVLNLHYRGPDDRPVPGWIRKLIGQETLRRGLVLGSANPAVLSATTAAQNGGEGDLGSKMSSKNQSRCCHHLYYEHHQHDVNTVVEREKSPERLRSQSSPPRGATQRSSQLRCEVSSDTISISSSGDGNRSPCRTPHSLPSEQLADCPHVCDAGRHEEQPRQRRFGDTSLHVTVEALANELSAELQQMKLAESSDADDYEFDVDDFRSMTSPRTDEDHVSSSLPVGDTTKFASSAKRSEESARQSMTSSRQILNALHRIVSRYDRDDAIALTTHEWRRLAVIVDKVLFWIFLVGTVASTVGTLVVVPLIRWI